VKLEYESTTGDRVDIDVGDGRCVVTFPLTPAWVVVVSIASMYGFMVATLVATITIISLIRPLGLPFGRAVWLGLCLYVLGALTFGVMATSMWRTHRRFGNLRPSVMIGQPTGLLRWRPERRGGWRERPLSAIRDVRVRPIRAFVGGPAGAMVIIRFRPWRLPMWFSLRQTRRRDGGTVRRDR
jgi:hypothetical protein